LSVKAQLETAENCGDVW